MNVVKAFSEKSISCLQLSLTNDFSIFEGLAHSTGVTSVLRISVMFYFLFNHLDNNHTETFIIFLTVINILM